MPVDGVEGIFVNAVGAIGLGDKDMNIRAAHFKPVTGEMAIIEWVMIARGGKFK